MIQSTPSSTESQSTRRVPARYAGESSFERMLEETRPDLVMVVTMDRYHAPYIIATFAVNFSSPFERNRFVFNGTRGRLEYGYPFAPGTLYGGHPLIIHYPLFTKEPREIKFQTREGGHGGGDPSMLEDLLSDSSHICRSSALDGAYAVALGEGMWRSALSGERVQIADLLGEFY